MRFALLFFLIAQSFLGRGHAATLPNSVRLFGKDYVRAPDWAKANGFKLNWLIKEKELRATNASARILLNMNSRRAQINGINLMLCRDVILFRGIVYIPTVDLLQTIHPVVWPKKNPEKNPVKTICLDAGHGGKDPGNIEGSRQEKKYSLLLSEEVERILKQSGFKVVRTRTRDVYVEKTDRSRFANRNDADLFVSLHYNSARATLARGVEIFCLTPQGTSSSNGDVGKGLAPVYPAHRENAQSVLLAYQMQKSLVKSLGVEDRGVKRAQFVVLLDPRMPAVLVEAGFMTNPGEAKRIYDPAYRKRMAVAIVDAILAYKKAVDS